MAPTLYSTKARPSSHKYEIKLDYYTSCHCEAAVKPHFKCLENDIWFGVLAWTNHSKVLDCLGGPPVPLQDAMTKYASSQGFGNSVLASGPAGTQGAEPIYVVLDQLQDGWLATARANCEGQLRGAAHRGLDLVCAAALLLTTFPLLVLVAIAIKLDSHGPVFYGQERVGLGGRPFTIYKFRSMRADAEAGGAPEWARKQDPRVTRVGRFLRLTRIDEIPQVFNVLLGDMALVGPRPERPAFVETLERVLPFYNDRTCVRPGITGWAQVNYPYGASVEDARNKLAYDLYYIQHRGLRLDLRILLATIRVVLFLKGAR